MISTLALTAAAAISTHPISLASIILGQTLFLCINTSIILQSPWFSFILFMIFLGGIMILFMYITSLAANENFSWSNQDSKKILLTSFSLLNIWLLTESPIPVLIDMKFYSFSMKLYSPQMLTISIILMIYLLITLVVIAEIIKLTKGPMRSLF